MATKAKLTLSQFLFRRTSNNHNSVPSPSPTINSNNAQNNGSSCNEGSNKSESFSASGGGDRNIRNVSNNKSGGTVAGGGADFNSVRSHSSSSSSAGSAMNRKMSGGTVSSAGGRQAFYEYSQSAEIAKGNAQHDKPSSSSMESSSSQNRHPQQHHHQTPQHQAPQQLQGILKKTSTGDFNGGGLGGRTHRSSLHRSKSNPNPSSNPLKEVSWSCPTLEKRREVILNYFERIILENKQEAQNLKPKPTTKPNIPCEGGGGGGGNGEPIYEEISEFSSSPPSLYNDSLENNNNRTGSLKPKLGPKKVRMNIPQEHQNKNGNNNNSMEACPIYDKVLCRSHSMHESSSSSSQCSSSFYDIAPSVATSVSSSSSGSQSLYENYRPSTYYATSSSSDSDYGIVGGGLNEYATNNNGSVSSGKSVTTRIAGRSHSFHESYRNSGSYNIQAASPLAVDTDQLYAKVCKRKKSKANNEQQHTQQQPHPNQRPSSYPSAAATVSKVDYEEVEDQLRVQVSCGNVVTMIPVIMPCSTTAASSFSTSCLSLSSSSDNNIDDMMTITTSISSINSRNNNANNNQHHHHNNNNQNNGIFHYEAEKIIPDKNFAYMKNNSSRIDGGAADSCPPSSAAARNRNNLSVIHLLATYDPSKEVEEFIPTAGFTAIIDSTESAPKSISVPVRVGFSSTSNSSSHTNNNNNSSSSKTHEESSSSSYPTSRQPLMVTNCSFGYDNDAFQDDDEDADEEDNNNHHQHKNLLRSSSTSIIPKEISSSSDTSTTSSTSGADEGNDDDCSTSSASGTSDSDTDEDEHHAQKYSFTTSSSGKGNGRGVLKNHQQHHHHHPRVKSISFQEDTTSTNSTAKDLLVLTTSESEDDEELCEHKSLIDMNTSPTTGGSILDESSGKSDKYGMSLIDDEDRGFDSFLDDSENGNGLLGEDKGDSSPASFRTENLKNQRTFAQMTQDVPQEQLKKKAASVLDLINSEISDLHMRELELKKLHISPSPQTTTGGGSLDNREIMNNDGSAEEEFEEGSSGEDDFSDSAIEYDGFTTNGSHSSGQVSPSENLNEMISHQEELQEKTVQIVQKEENPKVGRGENEEDEEEVAKQGNKMDVTDTLRSEVKVRPLEEEEDRSIKFLISDETPIEREIRLTKEREEEFRRNNQNYLAICPPAPASHSPKGTASLPIMKTRDVASRPESQGKPEMPSFPMDKTSTAAKDIQLEMATARFKREIEESMKREKELIREARQKKDVNEDQSNDELEEVSTPERDEDQNTEETLSPAATLVPPPKQPTPPSPTVASDQSQLRKPTLAKLPIAKLPAARFFAPPSFNANKPSRITPVVSPIISKGSLGFPSVANNSSSANGSTVGGSLPVGISRPSFTSFEKYIMQTSMNYMANKQNSSTPTATPTSPSSTLIEDPLKTTAGGLSLADPGVVNKALQFNIPEDPLRIILKPSENDESTEGGKEEDDEKPKKRYIPAQDKIHKEIQDLAMREKELNRTRAKWKSTLDLPEALKDAEEENEALRRTTSTTQSSLSLNASSSLSGDNSASTHGGGDGTGNSEDANHAGGESDLLNYTNVTSEDVRQVIRVKAPARRRHSLLINQWEERIRQQQQQNGKK